MNIYEFCLVPIMIGVGCAFSLYSYWKYGNRLRLFAVFFSIGLCTVRSLNAYPTDESRAEAAEIMQEASRNAFEAAVNLAEAVLHAGEPPIAAIDAIQAGVNLSNALDKTKEALEVLRNAQEDIMSSQGLLEWSIETEQSGTTEREQQYEVDRSGPDYN